MPVLPRALTTAALALASVSSVLTGAVTAAGPSPAATNGSMVAFGDSVPSGSHCSCTPFPRQYAGKVGAHTGHRVRMRSYAFGGATSADVVKQVRTARVRSSVRGSSTAVVMIGANDFGGAFDNVLHHRQRAAAAYGPVAHRVQGNVTEIIRTLRRTRPGIKIVVAGYWNVMKDGDVGHRAYGTWGMAQADRATSYANAALRHAAAATHTRYVSTYVPFRGTKGRSDPTSLLAADGDHPNARGHGLIADAVYKAAPNG